MIRNQTEKLVQTRRGFSLFEIVLGIAFTGVILTLILGVVSDVFRINFRNSQLNDIEQAKNDMFQELSNAVRWAITVNYTPPLTINDGVNDTFYELDTSLGYGRLRKKVGTNPYRQLTSTTIDVVKFEYLNYSVDPNFVSLEFNIELINRNNPSDPAETLKFVVSQRKSSYAL